MAEKAKAKKKDNKKLIACICCCCVVVIIAIVVAVIFATRGPQINDAYFVSDGSKYVLNVDNNSDDENAPIKTHIVYTYSGDKITGMFTYGEFKDEATAKNAFENYESVEDDSIKNVSLNGKYIVIESAEDEYKDLTPAEVKSQIELYESFKNINLDDSESSEDEEE